MGAGGRGSLTRVSRVSRRMQTTAGTALSVQSRGYTNNTMVYMHNVFIVVKVKSKMIKSFPPLPPPLMPRCV